uniref:Transcription termination factor 2 n=1 Tax=Leptobrachium leishanense TaxID=445787 RepID=A0A8C5RDM0_9ANUR
MSCYRHRMLTRFISSADYLWIMEAVRCAEHGCLCFLKTGTRDGPHKGQSFYVCGAKSNAPCTFTQHTDVPTSHCLLHEDHVVELQALIRQDSSGYRLCYRCVKGKADGKKWCGDVPWQNTRDTLSQYMASSRPSHMKTENTDRNPFRAPSKEHKPPTWKEITGDHKRLLVNEKPDISQNSGRSSAPSREESRGQKDPSRGTKDESRGQKDSCRGTKEESGDQKDSSLGTKEKSRGQKDPSTGNKESRGKKDPSTVTKSQGQKEPSTATKEESRGQKDPSTATKEESRSQKEPSTATKEESRGQKDPSTATKEESRGQKEPSTATKEESRSQKEPSTGTKEESRGQKEPSTSAKGESLGQKKPSTDTKEESRRQKEPSTATKEESRGQKDPSTATKEESRSQKEPSTGTKEESRGQKEPSTSAKGESLGQKKPSTDTKEESRRQKEPSTSTKEESQGQKESSTGTKEYRPSFQTWRGKELPPGIKLKPRVQGSPEGADVKNTDLTENLQNPAAGASPKIPTASEKKLHSTAGDIKGDRPSEGHQKNESGPQKRLSEEEDDDVMFVSSQPGKEKLLSQRNSNNGTQRTITSFPGFSAHPVPQNTSTLHGQLTAQLQQKKATLASVNVKALPDGGQRLMKQVQDLEDALGSLKLSTTNNIEQGSSRDGADNGNPFRKHGSADAPRGVKPLSFHELPPSSLGVHAPEQPPSSSQNYSHMYGVTPQWQSLYGGRMTEDRLFAVRNATSEVIDHLHKSLESCPAPDCTAEDPRGLKVPLLLHQKQALAWLQWRETQQPQGGILADDMGLGKTLTMIALILAQRQKQKKEKEEGKKLETWISKTDSTLIVSRGNLIICPASLIHHWKKEVEKRVADGRLRVCLYHGANREKDSKTLAQYDLVVTTYSLVAKEIPVKKEDGDAPAKDQDLEDKAAASSPLLRVAWARIILDEAHNIKNPKVQTSVAVCKLRAGARWAVTGTPIQNNLLDMYSLLRFLRCSPFDEFKLWKNQVDNGSRKGGERLNILTKSLLLRRTKDQLDSTGRPLVVLPQRRSELHRLTLTEQEQAVYDVIFARSRSTLQSYLKRQEGGADPGRAGDNPFQKVAREFGSSACELPSSTPSPASSTVHILSLLLRLRQCCCHLSLLKLALDQLEMRSEGLSLSLEEQLNALTLCELQTPDPKPVVSLNGTRFPAQLFEPKSKSTKIDSLLSELRLIRGGAENQKCVIVSQWTSMLRVVAFHLESIGLSYATIDGSVPPKTRMDLVEEFNGNPRGPEVMLISLCAGGVGLNLVGGNHLFLLDMHWNPALEDQACDRIYRVGQYRDVVIHRFVCLGTVEEKISELQEKKKDLASKVLSGNSVNVTKLTLADLRLLFGV